jgi:hypothetical protein
VSARFKGRRRQAELLTADLAGWAQGRDDVDAVVLVGSYARGAARLASDVDLVILSPRPARLADDASWFAQLRPGSTLIRAQAWGPLLERRYRLRNGLHVELGLASPTWAASPLDPGTRRVLGDGHVVLHDPHGLLAAHDGANNVSAG